MTTSLHIEGNLIAGDFLAEVVTANIKGQNPEDFGFAKSDKLADEIATVWGEAKKFWSTFKRSREDANFSESGTTETRKAWAVPLLYNLGYLPSFKGEAEIIDRQSFAISHRAESGENQPPIHIAGCNIKLDRKPPNLRMSSHALMQEYLNRTDHLWGIVTNGLQWRLLRDSSLMTRLTYIEFDLEQILEGENFRSSDYFIVCFIDRVCLKVSMILIPAYWSFTTKKLCNKGDVYAIAYEMVSKRRSPSWVMASYNIPKIKF